MRALKLLACLMLCSPGLLFRMQLPAAEGKAAGATFQPNPALKDIPAGTLKVICPAGQHKGDRHVLDFSGTVYDPHRHKLLTFGGGHATEKFPNSVHEFDLATLKWTALTEDVPSTEYVAANSVKSKGGKNLGGVRWKDKVWAGSRHTYDGLVVLPDKDVLVSMQAMEFKGGHMSAADFDAHYYEGSGLWTFDPVKRAWSVSENAGLALLYCYAEISPRRPSLIYYGNAYSSNFQVLDLKTLEVKKLPGPPMAETGSDMSMAWYPERDTFFVFPSGDGKGTVNVSEFNPAANAWTKLKCEGDLPNTCGKNVVYDQVNKVFVCFAGRRCYYLNPQESKWYKIDQELPLKRLFHHHSYDPVNNVHIMVGDAWETYAYKLSDEPGKLPGTGPSR